ncbi:uncharacterized protein LOC126369801 [Pectinophora gossypiella]|uniref:uncharacterized protein LOC126369801 n=1 Tax=Pectinophora gossypiella TaxID=13191 RepID=UPI00214F27E7|nr:uncharacterized protein LOC126369801 [Pectinophora gossypiella]
MDPAQVFEASEVARHLVINEVIARGDSRIQQFYSGAVIFITGGSGFLGKQLIEKLFRACEVKKLFILLRPKKQKSVQERLHDLLKDPVYESLRTLQPNFADKIIPVPGDVTEKRLGINDGDWKALTEEVDIIYHGAATINFTEPLKKATLTNVRGTQQMLLLGKSCKRLRSFVHVSTAYVPATPDRSRSEVLEKFYESPISPDILIQMAETMKEKDIDSFTSEIIKPWPNTYSFTKAVAEEAVRNIGADLPICIVRPAIVICAYREPNPGWIDKSCVYGPSGFVVGSALGVLRVLYADTEISLDLVPVDLVNNAIIAAAHETAVRRARGDTDIKIYTVTGSRKPIKFGKMVDVISIEGRQLATNSAIWYGYAAMSSNLRYIYVLTWLLHYIPGYLIDGVLKLLGKKPLLMKVYDKADKLKLVLGYFMNNEWNFRDSNTRQLYWNMTAVDRTIFNCNMDTLDWILYIRLWCLGCRKYIIKDELKDTLKANRKQFLFGLGSYCIIILSLFLVYKTFSLLVSVIELAVLAQVYVALSRVKALEGIALSELLNKPHDKRALAEMQRLRNLLTKLQREVFSVVLQNSHEYKVLYFLNIIFVKMDPAQVFEASELARHRVINETIARGDSRIQRFYSGAVIFITGGSGFLGKQLIEKLFRSCEIKKIYLLLRSKKEKSSDERLKDLLKDPVFEQVRGIQPNFEDKMIPVSGDITEKRLGISHEDWKAITEEVDIIYHSAATIHFGDPLKKAALTNVRGTQQMLLLGKACKKLRSYVHISTAYTHATPNHCKKRVFEKFYDSPISPDILINMAETMAEETLDTMTSDLIKPWPNPYSFTKAVAEEAVRTIGADLPICIVRPAIVISAYREPVPGWIDKSCVFGPSGFVVGAGLGILHAMYVDPEIALDLVPVDYVNNTIIAAAHETVVRKERGETDIKIYTVTGSRHPIKFGKMVDVISIEGRQLPSKLTVWYGYSCMTSNRLWFYILLWFLHYIPGYLVDGILKVAGKKPILVKVYEKVDKLNGVFQYYMTNEWNFQDSNTRHLYWNLSPVDRTIFNCNMDTIDWMLYIRLWCLGCRKYIIKDGLTDTATGSRKQFWLRIANHITIIFYLYLVYKLFSLLFSIVSYIFFY